MTGRRQSTNAICWIGPIAAVGPARAGSWGGGAGGAFTLQRLALHRGRLRLERPAHPAYRHWSASAMPTPPLWGRGHPAIHAALTRR